jgi:hypothetical protein
MFQRLMKKIMIQKEKLKKLTKTKKIILKQFLRVRLKQLHKLSLKKIKLFVMKLIKMMRKLKYPKRSLKRL